MDVSISLATTISFSLYLLALFGLLVFKRGLSSRLGGGLFAALLLVSYANGILGTEGLAISCVLAGVSGYISAPHTKQNKVLLGLSWAIVVLGSLALSLHILPGFHNEQVFPPTQLGNSSLSFQLYANIDKAIAAYVLLNACISGVTAPNIRYLKLELAPSFAIAIILIFGTGMLLGVQFEPKIGELIIAFAFFNLVVTCLAEEVFFRCVIQDGLMKLSSNKAWQYAAATLSAIIFTLAHFHTGEGAEQRLLLIFLAGLFYAAVYLRSRSLYVAVAAHYCVNMVHIALFTYPATFLS